MCLAVMHLQVTALLRSTSLLEAVRDIKITEDITHLWVQLQAILGQVLVQRLAAQHTRNLDQLIIVVVATEEGVLRNSTTMQQDAGAETAGRTSKKGEQCSMPYTQAVYAVG